ncbi:ribosome biogenesis protein NOP53-like [Varroa destructor]|uniref:Ribosome biogenesis protein NOP53 n=1 Tax=Varroa destructor TaxID=109461 RepID=A0A7M7JZC6_VARDE|nr:ribosome biogenesis protein NOP53-like [Varroa destructor]XP_022653240.1 ribosome biogenesis protein NOP53-like [Varroa destructor]XP_022653241.1 ribosome biogenesis protein NOP53-like [Varroa destructor]XP_022653242.1 ribosome biogenesis protein NOP53-like [Varroa destructor]
MRDQQMDELQASSMDPATEDGATGRKKKVRESKNRKKYWKKADITEVDEYLEDQRFNERVGGDVSNKEDTQLFLLDKSTDEAGERRFQKKRSEILKEPLRCHSILDQRSKVPVPYTKSRVKMADERKSAIHLAKERAIIAQRVDQSKKGAAKRRQEREQEEKKTKCRTLNSQTEIFDLWGSQKEKTENTEADCHVDVVEAPEDATYLSKDQQTYYAPSTRPSRPKVPALRYKKPSKLPAVEVAKPGASYRPTFEDHQELLSEAHEIEIEKLRNEQHLERVLTSLFPTKEEARKIEVENKKQEAVGILYSDDDDNDGNKDEDNNAEVEEANGNPRVLAENRKTRVQRNRQKAHQERLRAIKLAKEKKKFESQFGRIGVYCKEIKKANRLTQKRIEERKQREIDAMYLPRRLGKYKYRPQDIELKLSDEIPASLRQLKPEGSIMIDRMRSFERRNLIEPRRKIMRKKMWTKKVYKRSYKKGFEDVLSTPKADGLA